MIDEMSVNENSMKNACNKGDLTATDLADFLVKEQNLPLETLIILLVMLLI